jgi:metal-responsive CopG/Arc/MetJ family transcriptional regulator
MPTKKDILAFPADADLLKRIDDYRYENRIPSRSEALRRLIEAGLRAATDNNGPHRRNVERLRKKRPSIE